STANVMPPSSLTQTGVTWAPSARARTGGGTATSAGSGMGRVQAEAALLDDQAAVLDVEQAGVLGDGPGLGRGDAQLEPQRGGARRDRLAGDVGGLPGRAEHVDQAHLLGDLGQPPVDPL